MANSFLKMKLFHFFLLLTRFVILEFKQLIIFFFSQTRLDHSPSSLKMLKFLPIQRFSLQGFVENILPFPAPFQAVRLGVGLWTGRSFRSTAPSPRTKADCPTQRSLPANTSRCFHLRELLSSPPPCKNRTTWPFFHFSEVPEVLNNVPLFPHHPGGFVTLPKWSLHSP